MKKKLNIIFGLAVSVAILIWLYQSVDWQLVWKELQIVNYWWFVPATFIMFIQMLLRAVRWKYLLNSSSDLSVRLRFDAIMLGHFVNYLLPLRAGEFARPLFAARHSKVTFSTGFMSVVIERLFDLITVLFFFAVLLFASNLALPDSLRLAAFGLLTITGVLTFCLVLAVAMPKLLKKIADIFLNFVPEAIGKKINEIIDQVIDSAQVLVSPKKLFNSIHFSILIWLTTFLQFYVTGLLLNIELSIWFGVACGVIVALAVALPSAPGFLGVYQVGCLLGFSLFGIAKEHAITFSILSHMHQYLIIILYGLFILIRYGVKFKDLEER